MNYDYLLYACLVSALSCGVIVWFLKSKKLLNAVFFWMLASIGAMAAFADLSKEQHLAEFVESCEEKGGTAYQTLDDEKRKVCVRKHDPIDIEIVIKSETSDG